MSCTSLLFCQVDFDDGHCPTWRNQLIAFQNINLAVQGKLPGAPPSITTCPVLMLRPRAWNMIEHNILVCSYNVVLLNLLCIILNSTKQRT